MVAKMLSTRSVQLSLNFLIPLGAVLVVFTPNFLLFKWGANYAVHIMFAYLGLGMLFLLLRQSRLMFISLACCAGLCLYLRNASNIDIIPPQPTGQPVVNIAHFNISASNEDVNSTIQTMMETDADFISVQELTPDWGHALQIALSYNYPYHTTVYRPQDFMGLAVYSKYPLATVDTFYYGDIPNLLLTTEHDGNKVSFLSSYIYPELSGNDYDRTLEHFDLIAHKIKEIDAPLITLGDMNQVQWSAYIKRLRAKNNLMDSRRFPFFDNPTDHIFYSEHFKCLDFKTVTNDNSSHLGINGSYELNVNFENASKKTAQKF